MMIEAICFCLGAILGIISAIVVCVQTIEFYKGRYERAAELLKIIESEINKNMEEEQ